MPEQQISQQLAELLTRIAKLPSLNLEPPQFFAQYLQLAVAATGSQGGAIWLIQGDQGPNCYCYIDLELCGINESEDQKRLLIEAVGRAVSDGKTLVVPAGGMADESGSIPGADQDGLTNGCSRPLFFKPLRAGNQVAMVLQMIGPEGMDVQQYRLVVGLLNQIGETAETYLAHRRAAVLEDDRKALARLLKFAEGVHSSLDTEKVVYQISNLGRDAIGCTRLVVWVDPQVKRGLCAVSGVDKPDRRTVLMQALDKLSRHCLSLKKPILASREQLKELPEEEELTELLRHYFHVSQLDQIYLQPIEVADRYVGVVIAEGFSEELTSNMAGVVSTVARHGGLALHNALDVAALPVVRPLARLKKKVKDDPKLRRRWVVRLAVVLVLVVLGALMPWPIRINCSCELVPKQSRVLDSPLDGAQIVSVVIPSGEVKAGDVIVRLNTAELQAQLLTYQADQQRAKVELTQAIRPADRRYTELKIQRLQSQIDLTEWKIKQCEIRSPIDGVILTPQLELREGQTLKRGDPICEIADLNQWQLLLSVPHEEIGWVYRGLEASAESKEKSGLEVEFFLAAYPEHKISTRITDMDQIGQIARIKDKDNVFEVRVDVDRSSLEPIQQGLRSGSTGRAKITTCDRPLIYVLLRKVIRFFRVTFF